MGEHQFCAQLDLRTNYEWRADGPSALADCADVWRAQRRSDGTMKVGTGVWGVADAVQTQPHLSGTVKEGAGGLMHLAWGKPRVVCSHSEVLIDCQKHALFGGWRASLAKSAQLCICAPCVCMPYAA